MRHSVHDHRGRGLRPGYGWRLLESAEHLERFPMLPVAHFPDTVADAQELATGDDRRRFDLMFSSPFRGLVPEADDENRRAGREGIAS